MILERLRMMWWWKRRCWTAAARVGDVASGQLLAVHVAGLDLVLGRDGERYFATQRRCPHRGADLVSGFITGAQLVCRQHGWRFSCTTGKHDGAIDACLDVHAVRVVGETIEIDAAPRRRPRR